MQLLMSRCPSSGCEIIATAQAVLQLVKQCQPLSPAQLTGGCMAGRRAVALVLLAGLAGVAHAGVIAVGSLQSCVNDGSVSGAAPAHLGLRGACLLPLTCRCCRPSQNHAASLECQNKIVVTLNIESGSLYQTEELSFSVSCVNRCMLCAGCVAGDR